MMPFARSFFSSCVSIENSMDFLVRLVMVLTSTSFKHFSFGRSKACISIVYTRENQLISRLRMIFSFRQKQMASNVSWLRCLRIWLWGSGGHLPISIRDETTCDILAPYLKIRQMGDNQPFPNIFYDPLFTTKAFKKSELRLKRKEVLIYFSNEQKK